MQEGLKDFKAPNRAFTRLLRKFPQRHRELHERVGQALQEELNRQISSSGLKDASGKVRDWQVLRVGSLGGYVTLSAVYDAKGGAFVGDNSPGAITNYLENGHAIRPRLKPSHKKITSAYVNGYHFYAKTAQRAESIALREADAWAEELLQLLEEERG